jgi:hypothetical protein
MKAERSITQDRPLTTSSGRARKLTAMIRGQRPGATHRDEANSPLDAIEAAANRTVAESWGCWS